MNTKLFAWLLLSSAFAFWLAACTPAPFLGELEGELEEAPPAPFLEEAPEEVEPTATDEPSGPAGEIVIATDDACAVVTQEQAAAAFGMEVVEVNADTQAIGTACEYAFTSDFLTMLQINIYSGDAAKHYFAGLNQAGQAGCQALADKMFDIPFNEAPDSGQAVSGLSLGDLYEEYLATISNCTYAVSEARLNVGQNVLASEVIFLSGTGNLAVLGSDRVVEFTYQAPIPDDVAAQFGTATDHDSIYALAQPYRDSVLVGYTEILIGLLLAAVVE